MLWEVKVLPKPAQSRAKLGHTSSQPNQGDSSLKPPALTRWNDQKHEDESKGFSVNPLAEEFYRASGDVLFYPGEPKDAQQLRNTFYNRRRSTSEPDIHGGTSGTYRGA